MSKSPRWFWFRLAAVSLVSVASSGFAQESESEETDDPLEELLDESPSASQAGPARTFGLDDLSFHFAEGPLAKAKAQFDRGRFRQARALFAELGDSNPVRYLRALSALGTGDVMTGTEELEALAQEYPPMRDYALLAAAKAVERLKPSKAIELFSKVSPGSLPFAQARLGQARVLKRLRQYDEAILALTPLCELPDGVQTSPIRLTALLSTCDLARWKGDYNAERRALLEVWATSPFSPQAEVARKRLGAAPVPGKWKLRRAEALVALHYNRQGMELAEEALAKNPLPSAIGCRAGFILGNALRKERQHRKAIAALTPIVDQCLGPELRPQALFVLGYSLSVVEREAAPGTYQALAREYPEHPLADDALFFAAQVEERAGNADSALALLTTIGERYRTGNVASEALFKAAWIHQQRGDPAKAGASLDQVLALEGKVPERDLLRARYWKARRCTGGTAMDELFEQLAASQPATYYGELARQRLVESTKVSAAPELAAAICEPTDRWPLEMGPLASDPHFLAGVELYRLGLGEPIDELLAVNRKGQPEQAMRLLHQVMLETGHVRAANVVARSALGETLKGPVDTASREIWEAVFPLRFRTQIERSARAAKIDPNLLQALIREESRFNPWAKSSTGALGLTQLMPATARRVASGLRLKRVSKRSLLNPNVNVRIGAAYLGSLVRSFEGHPERAIAAYNAGPAAVNRWLRAAPEASMDEWVEEIPFDETREYVKRVLGSYYAYQLVYQVRVASSPDNVCKTAAADP